MANLSVTIICQACQHAAVEAMPIDRCVYFYECPGCGMIVKPKPGDCCVYCLYGDKGCPFMQNSTLCSDFEN